MGTNRSVVQKMSENGSEQKAASSWKSFLAGGAGGINAVIFGHPLDTIKVRGSSLPRRQSKRNKGRDLRVPPTS